MTVRYLCLVFNISISCLDKRTFGSPQRLSYLICAFIGVSLLAPSHSAPLYLPHFICLPPFSLSLAFLPQRSCFLSLTASFISLFTLFHHWSLVDCVLVYFLLKDLRFSAILFHSNPQRNEGEKSEQSCEVAWKECAMLALNLPVLLSLSSTLIPPPHHPSLVFIATGVCLCVCALVSLCVCVCPRTREKPPKVGPMTSDLLLLPKLPVAETIKKSRQCCIQKEEKGWKKEKGRWRTEWRKRAGKEGKASCKQHNVNESLAKAQSCSERVPLTNPPWTPPTPHPTLPWQIKSICCCKA